MRTRKHNVDRAWMCACDGLNFKKEPRNNGLQLSARQIGIDGVGMVAPDKGELASVRPPGRPWSRGGARRPFISDDPCTPRAFTHKWRRYGEQGGLNRKMRSAGRKSPTSPITSTTANLPARIPLMT